MFRPHLAVSLGDPASIGPEVGAQALKDFLRTNSDAHVSLFGCLSKPDEQELREFSQIHYHATHPAPPTPGAPSKLSGEIALLGVRQAAQLCIEKKAHALVTGPVDKHFCSLSEPNFVGQTEFLKEMSQSASVTMMLTNSQLRVALVTTHLAIRDISKALSAEKICRTTENLYSYLSSFIAEPKIAVCALNPHASDRGLFGDEEEKIISPAIHILKTKGIIVEGPLPADTAFCPPRRHDGFVCMYHDQALIPLKMSGFFEAINVSLGLPFLRASVDHGTAFDIAGQGRASFLSFRNALEEAYRWAKSSSH